MSYPDIIPYNTWINTQLSIARHYWWIEMNWKSYVVDWIFAKVNEDWKCFPDLVEEKLHMKMQKERKAETKAYYDECKRQQKEKTTSLPF